MKPLFRLAGTLFLGSAAIAQAAPPQVVTDVPVVHSLTSQVMEGVGEPSLLLDRGSEPHGFQIRPSHARALGDADLILWSGPGLIPPLDKALRNLDLRDGALSLLDDLQDTAGIAPHEGSGAAETSDDAAGATDQQPAEAPAAEVPRDPHAWLDPHTAEIWVAAIARRLSEVDPDNAEVYDRNAQSTLDRLQKLKQEVQATLDPIRERPILVFHDAYQPFAQRFGITVAGALTNSESAPPSAAAVARARERIAAGEIVCVMNEPLQNDALVGTVVEGFDVGRGQIDTAGTTLDFGPGLYDALIRQIAAEMADCAAGNS